jgi:hypothetical protein
MKIEFHLNVNFECIFIIQLGLNVIDMNWTQIHKLNWNILNGIQTHEVEFKLLNWTKQDYFFF